MKKIACFALFGAIAVAHAQEVQSVKNVTIIESTCTKQESESLVGAGIGGVGGAVAGKALGGLFGSTGGKLGQLAGGLGGAFIGNEMGKNVIYTCEVVASSGDKQFLVDYSGNIEPVVGKVYKLYNLTNGQVRLK